MRPILLSAILAGFLVLPGCAADGQRREPAPPPRDAQPTDLLPFVSFMDDTDGNGYRDTAVLTVLMFARNYPDASILAPGSLDLRLVGKGGRVIREWHLTADDLAGLAKRMPAGPAYYIRLSLLEGPGGDQVEETSADLHIGFAGPTGAPVKAMASGITIGRSGR
jgi:hypothetical protein